jgi:hypothetical protein
MDKIKIAIACQGGGSQTAFTAGVLTTSKDLELLGIAFKASYTHERARHAPPHQAGAEAWCDDGRDHGGAEALRRPRSAAADADIHNRFFSESE